MATFTNQATLTYNNTVTNSNIVSGEIVGSISAAKSATSTSYFVGDTITYIISLVNTSSSPVSAITLTDDLGAYSFGETSLVPLDFVEGSLRYYVNGAQQASPDVTSDTNLIITDVSLPACANAVIIYQAKVNSYAPLLQNSVITNTVSADAASFSTPVSADYSISVRSGAELSILKEISPQTVSENGSLTYTFTISNSGLLALSASDNAVITDTFSPALNNISVTFNGQAWEQTTDYTYDSSTGIFTSNAGQITVPAATYSQDSATGRWTAQAGTSTLVISGSIS